MAVDFESPVAVLFARLAKIAGLNYATRRLADWDQIASVQQPALLLTSDTIMPFAPGNAAQGLSVPLWKMNLLVVLYAQCPDPKIAPGTILNPLIAGVCNALLKTVGEAANAQARFVANAPGQSSTTLGGLCAYCAVAGKIEIGEALINQAAAAHIPLEMVLTS